MPSAEAQDRGENVTVERLYGIVKDQSQLPSFLSLMNTLTPPYQDQRLRNLEEENIRLNESLQVFLDDYRAGQGGVSCHLLIGPHILTILQW